MESIGQIFHNRLLGWYAINTIMKLRDNFHARQWNLSKADTVIDTAIEKHVLPGWIGIDE